MGLVVGAAVVRGGCVLAARRTSPAAAAGRWEFPGGKVEPGESPEDALVREVAEELGCSVRVRHWLAGRVAVGEGNELAVAVAVLVAGAPSPVEHDEVRWLTADRLDEVDWLEPDRPFLAETGRLLEAGTAMLAGVRGIFFEAGDAEAVAGRLRRDGYDAHVARERLAGEDDDEDHPWAVLTDAPQIVLDLLCDEYDGWLDVDDPAGGVAPGASSDLSPPPLPDGPRRVRRAPDPQVDRPGGRPPGRT